MGSGVNRLRKTLAAQRTPDDVRAVVAASGGERLLTWGRDKDGKPIVATNKGVWAYEQRLAWTEIDHVGWAEKVLSIMAIDGELRRIEIDIDRDLPAVIRAQIEASVIASIAVPLVATGRGATIVARRTSDSRVEWRVLYDSGVAPDAPGVRERVDRALAGLHEELGI